MTNEKLTVCPHICLLAWAVWHDHVSITAVYDRVPCWVAAWDVWGF